MDQGILAKFKPIFERGNQMSKYRFKIVASGLLLAVAFSSMAEAGYYSFRPYSLLGIRSGSVVSSSSLSYMTGRGRNNQRIIVAAGVESRSQGSIVQTARYGRVTAWGTWSSPLRSADARKVTRSGYSKDNFALVFEPNNTRYVAMVDEFGIR